MESETLRYELASDKQGLIKHFRQHLHKQKEPVDGWYHVHSDEMTALEQWIHGLLIKDETA